MGNIILNDDMQITTTKLTPTDTNELGELSFYVSKKFNEYNIFVALIDSQGVFDIVPLTYSKDAANYKVYCIDCKSELRIQSGKCKITLFAFDTNLQDCKTSKTLSVNLSIENYNLFHQTYITRKVSNDVANYYNKIVQITNMNIELYDKIMEGAEINEN